MRDLTDKEKEFWRISAAIQEILRVTDQDIQQNPDLEKLIYQVANVAILYRDQGADTVLQERRARELKKLGIPIIRPKGKK